MLQGKFCAGNKVVTSSKKDVVERQSCTLGECGGEIVKLARWESEVK